MPIETPLGSLQTLDELVAAVTADPGVAQRLSCPMMVLMAPMDVWMRTTTDPRAGQPPRPGVTMLPMFVVRVTGAAGGLAKRPLLMGRGEEADLALAFSALSKRHALFHPPAANGEWRIEDVGSRNGIFVEGARVPPNTLVGLPGGTRLRFGNIVGRFMLPDAMRADLLQRAKR